MIYANIFLTFQYLSSYIYFSICCIGKVFLSSPVLNEGELESLMKYSNLKPKVLPIFFDIRKGLDGSLENMLKQLCEAADEAVRSGSQLLVLSDRSEELVCTRFFVCSLCFLYKRNIYCFTSYLLV